MIVVSNYCLQRKTVYEIEIDDLYDDSYKDKDLFNPSDYPKICHSMIQQIKKWLVKEG